MKPKFLFNKKKKSAEIGTVECQTVICPAPQINVLVYFTTENSKS